MRPNTQIHTVVGLDRQVADALRSQLADVADRVVQTIIDEVPSYAGAFSGRMGEAIRNAVQLALGGFLTLATRQDANAPKAPAIEAKRVASVVAETADDHEARLSKVEATQQQILAAIEKLNGAIVMVVDRLPEPEPARIEVPTSIGKIRQLERIGSLKFSLKGQPLRLTAFRDLESADANRLFVPFSDLTSGTETYQAGRYMELDPTPTGIYVVDFNIAYNPYCYYSPEYDCPYPPKENRLNVPIRGVQLDRSRRTVIVDSGDISSARALDTANRDRDDDRLRDDRLEHESRVADARDLDRDSMVRKVAWWYAPGGPIYRRLAPKPRRSGTRREATLTRVR